MAYTLLILAVACAGMVRSQRTTVSPEVWSEVASKCSSQRIELLQTVAVDSDCRMFSACQLLVLARPTIQFCSPGTLFDPVKQVCNFADQVDCAARNAVDPCRGEVDGLRADNLRSKAERAAVLMCQGGRNIGGYFCSLCNAFGNSETGCVPISNCQATPTTLPTICNHEALPNNPNQYVAIGVKSRTVLTCGNGTLFSQDDCVCV